MPHHWYNNLLSKFQTGIWWLPHSNLWITCGDNFNSRPLLFTPRSSVFGVIGFKQFITAWQKFQWIIISIINGCTRWNWNLVSPATVTTTWFRVMMLEDKLAWRIATFHTKIRYVWTDSSIYSSLTLPMSHQKYDNHHHTLSFGLRSVAISLPGPYFSHQDQVHLEWFKQCTTAWPFQCLVISIMNQTIVDGSYLVCCHIIYPNLVSCDFVSDKRAIVKFLFRKGLSLMLLMTTVRMTIQVLQISFLLSEKNHIWAITGFHFSKWNLIERITDKKQTSVW